MQWIARLALLILGTLAAAELVLQGLSIVTEDRSASSSDGEVTILCVGDSHTYGTGVEPERAYPGQLQAELDLAAPGRFRVVNRGVPGFTTTHVLRRLPRLIERHDPRMIWVWVGVNDTWNDSETSEPASGSEADAVKPGVLEGLLDRSRLLKLLRVRQYGRVADEQMQRTKTHVQFPPEKGTGLVFEYEDGLQRVDVTLDEDVSVETRVKRRRANYAAIAALSESHGIPIGFLTYPIPYMAASGANSDLQTAAESISGFRLVETAKTMTGMSREERRDVGWGAHPKAHHYSAIAKAVAREVLLALPPPETKDGS